MSLSTSENPRLFDPKLMAQYGLEMVKSDHQEKGGEVLENDKALLMEQFGLSAKDASKAHYLFGAFILKYNSLHNIKNAELYEKKLLEMRKLLYEYHSLLSNKSGLNYDVKSAVNAELNMYSFFIGGDIPRAMASTARYFSTIYNIPIKKLNSAMKARERAITIYRGLHRAQGTETTWQAINESLTAYYNLLLQALVESN